MSISCPYCGSEDVIKRGFNASGTARRFACGTCGRFYTIKSEDLVDTEYAINENTETNTTSNEIADSTTHTTTKHNINVTLDTLEDIIDKAKRDENNNFLMKTSFGEAHPIGNSIDDIREVIRSNSNTTLQLDSEGVFVLKVGTTTKG